MSSVDLWNARAALGPEAGTRDLWAKRLEIETLKSLVRGPWILDAGCGDGETLAALAHHTAATVAVGVDFAPEMLKRARESYPALTWLHGSLLEPAHRWGLPVAGRLFDTIYTERALINLPSWSAQEEAIWRLAALVAPGGQLVLLENCTQGVETLSEIRATVGLPPMVIPAHNRYVDAAKMRDLHLLGFKAPREIKFSDLFYFLSRVAHAYEAQERGAEPEYDHALNRLGAMAPMLDFPIACGPGRIWVVERT